MVIPNFSAARFARGIVQSKHQFFEINRSESETISHCKPFQPQPRIQLVSYMHTAPTERMRVDDTCTREENSWPIEVRMRCDDSCNHSKIAGFDFQIRITELLKNGNRALN